jgi:hypothetical protein
MTNFKILALVVPTVLLLAETSKALYGHVVEGKPIDSAYVYAVATVLYLAACFREMAQ